MARIAGVNLQDNWKVDYALTNIKGIGWTLSRKILDELKISQTKRVSDLDDSDVAKITSKIEEYLIEGDLLRSVKTNINRLKEIGSYKGLRHIRSLPVRGQRTRTNARTKRGKRKTIGAFKKEILAKEKVAEKE